MSFDNHLSDEHDDSSDTDSENNWDDNIHNDNSHIETPLLCRICHRSYQSHEYTQHMASHIRNFNNLSATLSQLVDVSSTTSPLSHFSPLSLSSLASIPYHNFLLPASSLYPNLNGISFSSILNDGTNQAPGTLSYSLSVQYGYGLFGNDSDYDNYESNINLADIIGKVEIGVDDINKVSKIISKDHVDNDVNCSICMEAIKDCESDCRELICGHKHCDVCISKWLKKSKKCPICNVDLDEKLQNMQNIV